MGRPLAERARICALFALVAAQTAMAVGVAIFAYGPIGSLGYLGVTAALPIAAMGTGQTNWTGQRKLIVASLAAIAAGIGPLLFAAFLGAVAAWAALSPLVLCSLFATAQCYRAILALNRGDVAAAHRLTGWALPALAIPAGVVLVLSLSVGAMGFCSELCGLALVAGLVGIGGYCIPAFLAALVAGSARWWLGRRVSGVR